MKKFALLVIFVIMVLPNLAIAKGGSLALLTRSIYERGFQDGMVCGMAISIIGFLIGFFGWRYLKN